jgi:glucose-6-phosphate isomerase
MDTMVSLARLLSAFDPDTGTIDGCPIITRRLSDLAGIFADAIAYAEHLKTGDPAVYTVSTFDAADGPGQLHCGLGVIAPGRVGSEYFMTRGHLHARRDTAEIYVGLRGRGLMLMQSEDGSHEHSVELSRNGMVYVPGFTAHRTINTGNDPLAYLGVYPAEAGHDYEPIRKTNFRSVVIMKNGAPVILPRDAFLHDLRIPPTP